MLSETAVEIALSRAKDLHNILKRVERLRKEGNREGVSTALYEGKSLSSRLTTDLIELWEISVRR